ncbi:uncharacterized protein EV420DRAFT_1654267 [Desarmillaria tabescens]|uniref:MARVEL domain-containing protein n=1 Tax=Armillaria tabescens TaxID=1929756 RepID=A0AA39J279_ARMTA|nr:uncharacterized protein EV420DRAFT_1654267 [Desarmillaria tabescens]KAK0433931.1 hypothetical protein EV420DRAFT_1654267 [Desarmillaria tabescens]
MIIELSVLKIARDDIPGGVKKFCTILHIYRVFLFETFTRTTKWEAPTTTTTKARGFVRLWPIAVILLALTAYRIHFTKNQGVGYQPIIVELLVSSIFTVLWVPLAMFMIVLSVLRALETMLVQLEGIPSTFLLSCWDWPSCGCFGLSAPCIQPIWCAFDGKQCNIMTAILAFAWIGWSLLTLLGILALMHSGFASEENTGTRVEKGRGVASETTNTGTGQPVPTASKCLVTDGR